MKERKKRLYEYEKVEVKRGEIFGLEQDYFVITCHNIQLGNALYAENAAKTVVNWLNSIDSKAFIEDRMLQIQDFRKKKSKNG